MLFDVNVREAAKYLKDHVVGDYRAGQLVGDMQDNYNYVKKKRAIAKRTQDPSMHQMNHRGEMYDFEELSDLDEEGCKVKIVRPSIEYEAEVFREDIATAQKNKNSTKHCAFYALAPQVNKVVVNEIEYVHANNSLSDGPSESENQVKTYHMRDELKRLGDTDFKKLYQDLNQNEAEEEKKNPKKEPRKLEEPTISVLNPVRQLTVKSVHV